MEKSDKSKLSFVAHYTNAMTHIVILWLLNNKPMYAYEIDQTVAKLYSS